MYGNGLTQSLADLAEYDGLDRFGRLTDLNFKLGGLPQHRYQYGYDAAGNRHWARVTQVGHENERSAVYEYDPLRRLRHHERGELAFNGDEPTTSGMNCLENWLLDNLGNWSGQDAQTGSVSRYGDCDHDGVVETWPAFVQHHDVEGDNRIGSVTYDINTPEVSTVLFEHDANGNLTFDGTYTYRYDAFNHLVEVKDGGTSVARYAYDGLGRVIFKEWRVFPDKFQLHYYYDGVRRIQENLGTYAEECDAYTCWGYFDFEAEREYVYGPDYVDEFVAQVKPDAAGDAIAYVVQDANYNVVGLFDENGAVKTQYTYTPYGAIAAVDDFGLSFDNRIAHQGLFFDRYDTAPFAAPSLVPFTQNPKGHYDNRNRRYDPSLGRFTQRDPNKTAIPLLLGMARSGAEALVPTAVPNIEGLYKDGMNLYAYAAANPADHVDPSGLSAAIPEDELLLVRNFQAIWDSIVGCGEAYLGVQGAATFGAFWGANVTVLPKGAHAAAEVSQGFSDYADFYAEQLILLPFDVATAGAGRLARLAYVGSKVHRAGKTFRTFKSFRAFKRAMGSPGKGRVWHHIVEKNKVGQFTAETIHSTDNIVSIPKKIHDKISGYYSSKRDFTNGLRVRDWLKGQSWQEQYEFGLKTMAEFGL